MYRILYTGTGTLHLVIFLYLWPDLIGIVKRKKTIFKDLGKYILFLAAISAKKVG
jgi:hypothetical protein